MMSIGALDSHEQMLKFFVNVQFTFINLLLV